MERKVGSSYRYIHSKKVFQFEGVLVLSEGIKERSPLEIFGDQILYCIHRCMNAQELNYVGMIQGAVDDR